jgi:ribonuclease P/MRP protein subunit POP5
LKRLKQLIPALREKKRYLAFEIKSKDKMESYNSVFETIKDNFCSLFGQEGFGKSGLQQIPELWDKKNQTGIIRINNKNLNKLRAALAITTKINGQEVIARSVYVSGMLKKAKNSLG